MADFPTSQLRDADFTVRPSTSATATHGELHLDFYGGHVPDRVTFTVDDVPMVMGTPQEGGCTCRFSLRDGECVTARYEAVRRGHARRGSYAFDRTGTTVRAL